MSELQTRLQEALKSTYRLEKELGGGGMSRVFLAEELALGRERWSSRSCHRTWRPASTSSGSAVRSNSPRHSSIPISSRCTRPGQTGDDLFYYTMPLVEGESTSAPSSRARGAPHRRGGPDSSGRVGRAGLRAFAGRGAPGHQARQRPYLAPPCRRHRLRRGEGRRRLQRVRPPSRPSASPSALRPTWRPSRRRRILTSIIERTSTRPG